MHDKKISIVIPTKNEEENLKRLFKSLEPISDKIEVLIVDSLSTDRTEEIAKSKPWIRFISSKSTPGRARNIGIKNAKYDIVAMLDADTEVTKQWLTELLVSLKDFFIVAGYSPDPDGKQLPRVPVYIDGQDITYPQCNIAYRKSLFEDIGYLREDMNVGEDCEFHYRCIKKNYVILYNPKMLAYHYERPTTKGWIKKSIKNGFGRYEIEKIHPDLKHKHEHGLNLRSLLRLGFGALGYMKGRIFGGEIET